MKASGGTNEKYDEVRIWCAHNGFVLEPGVNAATHPGFATQPYVFETFDSLVTWLKANYEDTDNEAPSNL